MRRGSRPRGRGVRPASAAASTSRWRRWPTRAPAAPASSARAREVVLAALLDPATQDLLAGAGCATPDGELSGRTASGRGWCRTPSPAAGCRRWRRCERCRPRGRPSAGARGCWSWSTGPGRWPPRSPGAPTRRATLAQSSLRRAIRSISPDSDVGLWSFTTGLPDGDTEVLVPTGTLGSAVTPGGPARREALLDAVSGLDPQVSGGTPLYDAVLAGFRDAQADFAYGRLNALVVITDGRNEDDGERLAAAAARRAAAGVRRRAAGPDHRDRLRRARRTPRRCAGSPTSPAVAPTRR